MNLRLNGISVDCIIGDRPDERTRMQHLRVDVVLALRDAGAAETDSLADTVDYARLTEDVRSSLVAARCQMIERAAQVVLARCLAEDKVSAAEVTVTKSGSVANLESASVTVEGEK